MSEVDREQYPPRLHPAGTIAFPARLVTIGGGLLFLAGIALLYAAIERTRAASPDLAKLIGDGDLRPGMAHLPPDAEGVTLAFADREVTQGQFFRTSGRLIAAAVTSKGSPTACPARLDPDMPVTCVLPGEAAYYAEELTRLTNLQRDRGLPALTSCYRIYGEDVRWIDRNCTGFRLPTRAEFNRAAAAGGQGFGNAKPRCRNARMAGCPGVAGPTNPAQDREPNPWYLYDLIGNMAEIAFAEGDSQLGWAVVGGAWHDRLPTAVPARRSTGRMPDVGFRIVRTVRRAGGGVSEPVTAETESAESNST